MLGAPARHDGFVRVATQRTFSSGKRPCLLPRRSEFRRDPLRQVPVISIGAVEALAAVCTPVIAFARRGRGLGTPLLAFVVVIEERSFRADDLAAVFAIGPEAVLADQRTDPRRFLLD